MQNAIAGLPSLIDIVDELLCLQVFMRSYGFDSCFVRLGVVDGKYSFLTDNEAVEEPTAPGFWSQLSSLTVDATPQTISDVATKLHMEVSDSYALQTSYRGAGSGVVAIDRSAVNTLRMAN